MTERICSNWRHVPVYMPQLWGEMEANFHTIHSEHVKRVQANMKLLSHHYYTLRHEDLAAEIMQRHDIHDWSKKREPEYIPYVWRYYRTTWRAQGEQDTRVTAFMADESLQRAIDMAIQHHVLYNPHHPEYHRTPDDMTDVDIAEMCCDWFAMSQEHGTSIDDWIAEVIPSRFKFYVRYPYIIETFDILKRVNYAAT